MSKPMDLDMSKMNSDIKILNIGEIMKDKANGGTLQEIRIAKRNAKTIASYKKLTKEIETLETDLMKGARLDPWLRPIKYGCINCGWSQTTTRLYSKCPICKSNKLSKTILFDKQGNKILKPITIISQSVGQEKATIKVKESKSIKSKTGGKVMEEQKTYVVSCTNDAVGRCGFSYETNDAPDNTHRHKQCPRCNFPTRHTEKAPEKKVSRFDRK